VSPPEEAPAPRHNPLATLRQPNLLLFLASRLFGTTGITLLQAAIAWQVYAVSNSAFQLGLLGLARFVPSLGLTLLGGAAADSFDRRRIAMAAQVFPLAAALALVAYDPSGTGGLPLVYGLVLVIALAAAFENPARQALLPMVVRRETFAHAIAVHSSVQSLGFVTGPAVAGLVIGAVGTRGAYVAGAVLVAASLATMAGVRPRRVEVPPRAVSLAAIREGVRYVWSRQPLLGAMTLDMFAVIFGGATALLPVYAESILEVGPTGYGLLAAAADAGALIMSVALVLLPPVRRAGRTLLLAVAVFGLAIIVFGLSRSFALSLAAYMVTGMADQVSVVMRSTMLQLSTPDELRGRVNSVNMLFIGASNQLGAVESGFVAAVAGATFAVVSGGTACLAVVGVVAARMGELRRYVVTPVFVSAAGEGSARAGAPVGQG
jgi:MFS family permease